MLKVIVDEFLRLFSNPGFTAVITAVVGLVGTTVVAIFSSKQATSLKMLEIANAKELKLLELEDAERKFIYESALAEHKERTDLAIDMANKTMRDAELSPAFVAVLFQKRIYTILKNDLPQEQKLKEIEIALTEGEAVKSLLRQKMRQMTKPIETQR